MLSRPVFCALLSFLVCASAFPNAELPAEGGSHAGNGGGTIVCRTPDGKVRSIQLLDYFEARELRGLDLDVGKLPGDWRAKAAGMIERMRPLSALRADLYASWLGTFLTESKMLTGIVFSTVPDSMQIGVPAGCTYEQAVIQILPRFPGDRRYYINSELWAALDDTERAGLVLHEIVYREALSYGHTDSIATRYFVGILSSSRFASFSLDDFFSLLVSVRFEQTDVPMPGVDTLFDPQRLWRENESEETEIPVLSLKDRVVVDLGTCMDLGCTDFIRQTVNAESVKRICSGTTRLSIFGEEVLAVPQLWNPRRADSKCQQWIEISGGETGIAIAAEKAAPIGVLDVEGLRYQGKSASEVIFNLKEHRAAFVEMKTRNYTDDRLSAWSQAIGSPTPCWLTLTYDQDRHVRYAGFSGTSEGRDACISDFTILKKDFTYRVRMTKKQTQFEFDAAGDLVTDLSLTSISGRNPESSAHFDCAGGDRTAGCLTIEEKDAGGFPARVRAEEFAEYYFPYFMKGGEPTDRTGYCKIQPGEFELYPSSIVPREIVLREPCRLMTTHQVAVEFPAGAKIGLTPEGFVQP